MNFQDEGFQNLEHEQDRQTNVTRCITVGALVGDKNVIQYPEWSENVTSLYHLSLDTEQHWGLILISVQMMLLNRIE